MKKKKKKKLACLQAYPKTTGTLAALPPYSGMKYILSSTKNPEL